MLDFDGINFDYLLEEEVIQAKNHPKLSFQEELFVKLLEGIKEDRIGYGVIQTDENEQKGVILLLDPDTNQQIIVGYLSNELQTV
ncbi:hypothetical protein [Crocosphaera chwakensis]|uniref:Uncharacterized protein n=1 Tax=Crocosphaera chwakensis CCY0110 TaxID=391612 RepID=A3ISI5_9CHRO|nr:hypothetical protein [Crocosphaera chwakensis]EAZ90555.1 hypothetical protein CY0110_20198 [Crocosphaera chwakensis CCY0110]